MRQVVWNKLARLDFYEIVDYLLQNWSEKEAQNFINKVHEIEALLAKGNVEFQRTDRKSIRRFVVDKHVSLFYHLPEKNKV